MSAARQKHQEALCHYTKDIKQVIKFCEEFSKWKHAREEEMKNMMDIKDEADKISQSEKKGKASNWFRRRKMTADSRYEELDKELDKALTETREGLKNLSCFLGAVEKLNLFTTNEMLHFPEDLNLEYVQIQVIAAAHLFHPLLLEFRGEAKTLDIHKPFEVPKLENVEAMKHQLERYVKTSEKIFYCLGKSFISKAFLKMKTVDDQKMECREEGTKHMLDDINLLDKNRKQLQKALCCYTTDTLTYIKTVIEFCEEFSKWKHAREKESNTMVDIKNKADKLNMNFSYVEQSENKGKAFCEFAKNKLPKLNADSRREELQKELDEVLTETLKGLKNLSSFLDAVAKLAVTSLHVFTDNQLIHLPKEINLEHVQIVIAAARLFSPLVLVFKTDAKVFFLSKLQNVEVLKYQLDIYIQTSEKIFECLGKSFISKAYLEMKIVEDRNVYWPVDSMQNIDHINQLVEIRLDPDLQMVFLFQEVSCCHLINKFQKQKSEMLKSLNELEQCAVEIDNMDKGAKISSVAGSSVGAVGGVLSVVGLALAPFTAGVSLALTMTGVGLGVTSAVNSAVTTGTEIAVNVTQQKQLNKIIQKFTKDVQELQDCLLDAVSQPVSGVEVDKIEVALGAGKIAAKVGSIGKGIDSLVDAASAARVLKGGKGLRNAPRVAADIPDIGQAVVKAPLALSKTMRGLFIAGNVLFIGMDIFFICKDSMSLAKGNKTEVSQFIRARAALLRLELDSWQKIHDSLNEGLKKLKEKREMLEKKSSD